MKRKRFLITALVMAIAATLVLLVACGETDNNFPAGGFTFDYPSYPNVNNYTPASSGSEARAVKGIEIEWLAGNVTVEAKSDIAALSYAETVYQNGQQADDGALTDDDRMHYYFDGAILHIKYAAANAGQNIGVTKDLTVLVPTSASITSVEIETASANVVVGAITTRNLRIDATSGDVQTTANAQNTKINTASGDIKADILSPAVDFEADSAYGNVTVEVNAAVSEASAESSSGDVYMHAAAAIGEASVESMSGKATLILDVAAREVDVETISGAINIVVDRQIGFSLETRNQFALPAEVVLSGRLYVYQNGMMKMEVETATGAVTFALK